MIVIDARIAAIEIAKIMAYDANMENAVAGYHYIKDDFMDVAKEMVGNMPMLEIEPERHGKWIHEGYDFQHGNDWIHCSECGKRGINVPANLTNYCPNCGARMETENE